MLKALKETRDQEAEYVFLTNPLCSFELKAQFRNLLYKFKLHCADKSIILFFRDTEVQRE